MSDLVEALRRHRHHGPLFTQAADEIERLRTPDPLLEEAREAMETAIHTVMEDGITLHCLEDWLKKLGERDVP